MKTAKTDDELRPEYKRSDFGVLIRGEYAAKSAEESNEVVLEPEVTQGQHETCEFLVKALDEEQLSDRPLFPLRPKT